MPSSNFVDFIHCASRTCLGQNVKALVWRWRQICPLKIDIFTLNAPICRQKRYLCSSWLSRYALKTIHFDSRYILIARVDEIRILFLGHPVEFTRCGNNLKTVGNLMVKMFQDFNNKEMYLHRKNRWILVHRASKNGHSHHFRVFTRCRF